MQRSARRVRLLAAGALPLPLCALTLGACSTLPNGRGWGEDATVRPGWQTVGQAALTAVEDKSFWLPLAGAAVLQIDGWDRKVSNWARRRTPIFGSQQNAADWSDRLRSASSYAYFATLVATPSGPDTPTWLLDKTRGAAVGLAALVVTDEESTLLKNAAARERPNGQDDQSMPSSHASRSAVLTQLGRRNLEWIDVSDTTRRILDVGLTSLTLGTAWARVEAGFHYPSDTLAGMAIGNFNGAFFNDAFMGLAQPSPVTFGIEPLGGGAQLWVRIGW